MPTNTVLLVVAAVLAVVGIAMYLKYAASQKSQAECADREAGLNTKIKDFETKIGSLETAKGTCLTDLDATGKQKAQLEKDLAGCAVAKGACLTDLDKQSAARSACDTGFGDCSVAKGTCLADLDATGKQKAQLEKDLADCAAAKAVALSTMTASGCKVCEDCGPFKAQVSACETQKGTALADLKTCSTAKATAVADLAAANAAKQTLDSSLATCNAEKSSLATQLADVRAQLAAKISEATAAASARDSNYSTVVSLCDKLDPNATDMSAVCWDKVWKNAGCTAASWYNDGVKAQTVQANKNYASALANATKYEPLSWCYGAPTASKKMLEKCDSLPDTAVDVGPRCASKLWNGNSTCSAGIPDYPGYYATRSKYGIRADGQYAFRAMSDPTMAITPDQRAQQTKLCKGTTEAAAAELRARMPQVDCGYPNNTRGWYDFSGTGDRKDFCRFNGDGTTFACILAGQTKDTTDWTWNPEAPHSPYTAGSLTGNWSCPLPSTGG